MLNATKAIIAQLDKYDLLASQTSEITLPDRDTHTISGFMSIDEAKLSALEDAAFLELRKTGALAAIYCQLGSTNTWQYLLSRRSPTPPALQ